ncbi:GNAT family N-acetyltransferase [Algibacter pectinivorans]|uniref:Acetyltransferase (GNAT) family protein n=1 Tax=Algibacter pectinivorans TaxID=870482 RepID=A0A1I1QSY3_9FLAO|nr:GNAT family N-acetyltransferase [Algibacter pectinivorans]SFD25135.1 Acetyltransferase (GNAT) family protein [Algibacter pectinivorans]
MLFDNIKIEIANTTKDYLQIEKLADVIWREHYIPIVGKPQIDYMLEKFQSVKPITEQVKNGCAYYIINFEGVSVGYISIKKEIDALFLSKIYVLSSYRGKKIGKTAMAFVEDKVKQYKLDKIRLTVNIHNTNSIKAYEKLGFKNIGPIVADIGNGFIMDDYEMVKHIPA